MNLKLTYRLCSKIHSTTSNHQEYYINKDSMLVNGAYSDMSFKFVTY